MKERDTTKAYTPPLRLNTPLQQLKHEKKVNEELNEMVAEHEEKEHELVTEKDNLEQQLRIAEARIRELERENASLRNPQTLVDFLKNSDSPKKDSMVWFGVEDFEHFYNEVKPHLTPFKNARPPWPHDCVRLLQTSLAILRNGLHYRFAIPLLEPARSRFGLSDAFEHLIDDLYEWAVSTIRFVPAEEWREAHPKECRELFPECLFYFIDGTVLEINSPVDIKKNRAMYNSKHGICAWSYFIMVAPNGEIVYISPCELGSTHDSTAYDVAMAFPPMKYEDNGDVVYRTDQSLVEQLGEQYADGIKLDGNSYTPCIGGDKAYPLIDVPKGMSFAVVLLLIVRLESVCYNEC
jgi:hypothetical protein